MNNPLASKHQSDCLDTGVELQTCNHESGKQSSYINRSVY